MLYETFNVIFNSVFLLIVKMWFILGKTAHLSVRIISAFAGRYFRDLTFADVLSHCLYNPCLEIDAREIKRFEKLKAEFGVR